MDKIDPHAPMGLADAARMCNKNRRTLTAAVQRGVLPGTKIGNMWTVKPADVAYWLNFGNHTGGPKLHYKIKAKQERERETASE